jgi:hypothetical protein
MSFNKTKHLVNVITVGLRLLDEFIRFDGGCSI